AGPALRERHTLVQLHELAQRRDRVRAAAGALRGGEPGFVTEDEKVRRAPVVEADGDTRVDGMEDRALSLDPQQLAAPAASLDDEALGGAGDEVGDHRVDGDPPAGDRDPGLSRRNEDRPLAAAPRLEVELERDGHLPDRAIRADGEHDRAGHVEDLAGRRGEIRRWA